MRFGPGHVSRPYAFNGRVVSTSDPESVGPGSIPGGSISNFPPFFPIFYSGPEGARVKVSPLFFVIIIFFVFCVLNFLHGYKA